MTNITQDDAAVSAFVGHCNSIRAQLAALMAQCEDHFGQSPDDIDWGHVGDVARIDSLLSAITSKE